MILIFVYYLLMASTFTIGKAALGYAPPMYFIGMRMITAGLLLLGYLYFFNRAEIRFEPKVRNLLIAMIFFHIYFAYVLEFWSLQYIASAKACLLYGLSPYLSAGIAYFCFSERLSRKKIIGLFLGLASFLPVLLEPVPAENFAGRYFFISLPELSLLVAIISSVVGWIIFGKLTRDNGYSPLFINGFAMFFGGMLSMLTSLAFEDHSLVNFGWPLLGYTAAIILIANFIGYNLYGILLKSYTPTFLFFAGSVSPAFTAFYGWFFLGESVSWAFVVSTGLVALGLYYFYQDELGKGRLKE